MTNITPTQVLPQYAKLGEYLDGRIEAKKTKMHDYVKAHDYSYASREQQAIEEDRKLLDIIMGKSV
jgi:hypothetical protein